MRGDRLAETDAVSRKSARRGADNGDQLAGRLKALEQAADFGALEEGRLKIKY